MAEAKDNQEVDEAPAVEEATGDGELSVDEDLEAQMATQTAAEDLESAAVSDGDDLEAQMAAAMAEESDGDSEEHPQFMPEEDVRNVQFDQLAPSDETPERSSIDRLLDVTLNVSVELGRKHMQIKEVLDLGPGKIIELDKLAGEPVDLMVNGKLLARGEVVVVDENFGVRITELVDPVNRIRML